MIVVIPKSKSMFCWYLWKKSFWLCRSVTIIDCFFFFLAIILIIAMFNFQLWVRINVGTSLPFSHFNVLPNKSNCFGTVEPHFVQITVSLFHLTSLTDLMLYYFNLLYYWSNLTEYFLWIFYHYLLGPK